MILVKFRLSRSAYHEVFVLKGALLFELWTGQQYRPTRDADFLARGENSPERFFRIFRELCSVETEPDGLRFDPDTVSVERIAQDADYEGVRVSFTAYLERAKIPIQIDIGFGMRNAVPTKVIGAGNLSAALRMFQSRYNRISDLLPSFIGLCEANVTNPQKPD